MRVGQKNALIITAHRGSVFQLSRSPALEGRIAPRGRALADTDVTIKKRIIEQLDKAGFKEVTRDADVLEVVTDF